MSDTQPLLQPGPSYGGTAGSQPSSNAPPHGSQPVDNDMPQPTAPPDSMMETVTGYEGTTFQSEGYVAPPSYNDSVNPVPTQPQRPVQTPTHINERQARDSLLNLTSQNFCWGKKAAEEMSVSSITSSSAYHYQLDTFTEGRKSAWSFEPYHGGPVDGPFNGPAPGPWSIAIQPDGMFRNHQKTCEVPHTAYVKQCHDCGGCGKRCCHKCSGNGRIICHVCNGGGFRTHLHVENHSHHGHGHHGHGHHGHGHGHHGHGHGHHGHTDVHTDVNVCYNCAGTGRKICHCCNGCGQINCGTCSARGQLKMFIKLTVIWTTHSNDHIVESTALPDNLVRGAGGVVGFEDSNVRVYPVSHFPNDQVNSASQRLVQMHASSYPTERILMQRHKVRIVPISEIQADHKGKVFTFWVYGNDNRCHAPEYPQQCCCGCTIL